MARLARLYAPGIPQLAQAEFAHPLAGAHDPVPSTELDHLLTCLEHGAREYRVAVHGWLLLNDRLALLATASDTGSLPKLMQALARRLAARSHHGRVFANRYRNALIEPGRWVMPTLIWLESQAAALHYVDQAEHWPWSSAAYHAGVDASHDSWAVNHPDYWQSGNTPFARQAAYRQRLRQGLSRSQCQQIQQALFGQWALGDATFLASLETAANRRAIPALRGRPRKQDKTPV